MVPPPLAWVESYSRSIGAALGETVQVSVYPTVNPLVYKVQSTFPEALSGKSMMLVWNLFQMWATANDAIPQGKVEKEGSKLTVMVVVKRRLGEPRDSHPMG